ncbi:MAG: GGDEF domain-containing protein, partial [Planctomycetaceae bacterium]
RRRAPQVATPPVDAYLTRINGGLDEIIKSTSQLHESRSAGLSHSDLRQLQDRCNQLLDLITSDELEALVRFETESISRTYPTKAIELNWDLSPEAESTGLPDRTAFDNNLRRMLEVGEQQDAQSGLLLIKIEKFAQLVRRLGKDANILRWKMARVLCRALRESDVVCQFSDDAFAVLLPGVSDKFGSQLAQSIRDTIRFHRFRISESDDEILLTASFGLTFCRPLEPVDLLLNRAGDALDKSMRRGRNRLTIQEAVPPAIAISGGSH